MFAKVIKDRLWFDVERRYKTIVVAVVPAEWRLWFDVERRYKTIRRPLPDEHISCGLM